MAQERDNSGLLGINDRKERDAHPDRKGSCMVGGVEYWVSGWDKENQYGPFISLSFTRKDEKPSFQKGNVPVKVPDAKNPFKQLMMNKGDNFDDDIPFN